MIQVIDLIREELATIFTPIPGIQENVHSINFRISRN